jgi:hypothetical protein
VGGVCPTLRVAAVPANEDLHTVLILFAIAFAVISGTDWKNPVMGFGGIPWSLAADNDSSNVLIQSGRSSDASVEQE